MKNGVERFPIVRFTKENNSPGISCGKRLISPLIMRWYLFYSVSKR